MPLEEIHTISQWEGAQLNSAKQILADEATALLHGRDCLTTIHATAATLFGSGGGGGDLESLPKISISKTTTSTADSSNSSSQVITTVVDLLLKAEFATSKSEARRLIKAGGARINDIKIDSDTATVSVTDFDDKGRLKLSSGKKNHVVIVLT